MSVAFFLDVVHLLSVVYRVFAEVFCVFFWQIVVLYCASFTVYRPGEDDSSTIATRRLGCQCALLHAVLYPLYITYV